MPALTIGGLAIAEEWRGRGLVINLVKRGAMRVTGQHMHLFNLKKDRRLYPCAELAVWWYPIKPETATAMTLFKVSYIAAVVVLESRAPTLQLSKS